MRNAVRIALVCLVTCAALAAGLEFAARRIFRRSDTIVWSCFVESPGPGGIRAKPNSVCWEKLPESPLVEYRFDACGYRTVTGCAPKSPHSLRVVLIGSSLVLGYQVAYQQTFASLLQDKLSSAAGRPVEIDNQGILFGTPRSVAIRFGEALAAQPDLIVWTLTPWDAQNVTQTQDVLPLAKVDRSGGPPPPKWRRFLAAFRENGILSVARGSRSVLLAQHVLYRSPSQYMRNFLMESDEPGMFAREAPPIWRRRWTDLDALTNGMADRAHAAGVPFAVTAIPDLAASLMLSSGDPPPGLDPLQFGEQIRSIAERRDTVYLDVLSPFRHEPDPERLFYPVDGHFNAEGHAVVARLLAAQIALRFASVLKKQELPHIAANR